MSGQYKLSNEIPELSAFMDCANQARRLTIENNSLYLQVRKSTQSEGLNKLVIVLIELNEALRGSGQFTQFVKAVKETTDIKLLVELPQERLEALCERLDVEVIVDAPFDYS